MSADIIELHHDVDDMPIDQQLLDAIHRRFDDLKSNVGERMDDLRETVDNTAGSLATLAKEQSHGDVSRERIENTVNAIQSEQVRIREGINQFDVVSKAVELLRHEFDAHCKDHQVMSTRRWDVWKLVLGGTVIAGLAEAAKWVVGRLTTGGH